MILQRVIYLMEARKKKLKEAVYCIGYNRIWMMELFAVYGVIQNVKNMAFD